jgi:single-stranded DNA-binding protein
MTFANEVHISGYVATEPQQSGKGPHRFRLSHGGGQKKDGSRWPRQFYSVSVWDTKTVPDKGQRVELWGKLRQKQYTDKSGNKRESVEIIADSIQVEETEASDVPTNVHGVAVTDADIPF